MPFSPSRRMCRPSTSPCSVWKDWSRPVGRSFLGSSAWVSEILLLAPSLKLRLIRQHLRSSVSTCKSWIWHWCKYWSTSGRVNGRNLFQRLSTHLALVWRCARTTWIFWGCWVKRSLMFRIQWLKQRLVPWRSSWMANLWRYLSYAMKYCRRPRKTP